MADNEIRRAVDIEDLAADKRASIAAHTIALMIHDAMTKGDPPDFKQLQGWHERWHHAALRVREHGPDRATSGIIYANPN